MVQAFRNLCDRGLKGWRLHLAGSVHSSGPHAGYYETIRTLADGYPIDFHIDLPRREIEHLYSRASIYWHAAGYGVPANGDPEEREHFGLAPAEAMAWGAVPVVFDGGGLPEVVRDGEGFRWTTLNELQEQTLHLIEHPDLRLRLAAAGRSGSRRFSTREFKRRIVEAVHPLLEAAR
jgi:glycosyltransferase involved in cell wall biosynthesis